MPIQITVIGCTYAQFSSLDSAFRKNVIFDVSLRYLTYREALAVKEYQDSDFIIYHFTSSVNSSASLPLDNIDNADRSICLFETESRQSKILDRLGFSILYEPCSPRDLVNEVKEKLSVNLSSKEKSQTSSTEEKTLVFSSMDRYVMVDKDKIIHATSSGNYTTLYLNNQKEVTVTKQLGKVLDKLPAEDFFRVHHSHIVNRSFIMLVLKQNQLLIVLKNKVQVPVSRRRKKEFLTWLGLQA